MLSRREVLRLAALGTAELWVPTLLKPKPKVFDMGRGHFGQSGTVLAIGWFEVGGRRTPILCWNLKADGTAVAENPKSAFNHYRVLNCMQQKRSLVFSRDDVDVPRCDDSLIPLTRKQVVSR